MIPHSQPISIYGISLKANDSESFAPFSNSKLTFSSKHSSHIFWRKTHVLIELPSLEWITRPPHVYQITSTYHGWNLFQTPGHLIQLVLHIFLYGLSEQSKQGAFGGAASKILLQSPKGHRKIRLFILFWGLGTKAREKTKSHYINQKRNDFGVI